MQTMTDWAALWAELVRANSSWRQNQDDHWQRKARTFAEGVRERWKEPDSSRVFIQSQIEPDTTLLDIGAGTGAWSVLLAQRAARITAVERSPAMLEILRENLAAAQVHNVALLQGVWPEVPVEMHDYALCSHGMYGNPDLAGFILRMDEVTRRACFLLLRVPIPGNVMAEAAMHIWGQPHDSPNFVIAYNLLLQMGINANVLMETGGYWKPWAHDSQEEALLFAKRRMGLQNTGEYDFYLGELLSRRLVFQDGKYVWPPSVRSALVYWYK